MDSKFENIFSIFINTYGSVYVDDIILVRFAFAFDVNNSSALSRYL